MPNANSPPPQLTTDLFPSICGKSEPKDIYLAATLGGSSGDSSFRRPLEDMGIPVLVCSSYRLHSAVACSLGGAGGAGAGANTSGTNNNNAGVCNGEKCVNDKMRDVVRRAVSMVEIFQHWQPREGANSAGPMAPLETVRSEVEGLAVPLMRTRGANARRVGWARLEEK